MRAWVDTLGPSTTAGTDLELTAECRYEEPGTSKPAQMVLYGGRASCSGLDTTVADVVATHRCAPLQTYLPEMDASLSVHLASRCIYT